MSTAARGTMLRFDALWRSLRGAVESLRQVSGWQRYAVAFGLGCLSATAQAPYYNWLGLLVGLSGLVWLLDSAAQGRAPHRAALFTGWAFGWGYFLAGMYWIAFAFLVQAEQFGWMIPIAVPGLTAFLGLFIGVACWAVSFWWRPGMARVLALAAVLSFFEVLRGTLFTGLPWNLFGQVFAGNALFPQIAAWVGPYGLSLLTILIAALPAAAVPRADGWRWMPVAVSVGLFVFLAIFGGIRLLGGSGAADTDNQPVVAILQPNLEQRDKLDPDKLNASLRSLIDQTAAAAREDGATYAVWPENAYPFLAQVPDLPPYFGQIFPEDLVLISGTYRSYLDDDGIERVANSAVVFGETDVAGQKPVASIYDKHHLVPFGEYLPFKDLLGAIGLAQLAPTQDGFTPGPGPMTQRIGGHPFSILICYEDVFPRRLYPADARPGWLVVVTNDAWFGDNAGPKQHLDLARLRAIESGLPLARSANTGVSALFDAKGRLITSIPLYTDGIIVESLPPALEPQLYGSIGWPIHVFLLLIIVTAAYRLSLARNG